MTQESPNLKLISSPGVERRRVPRLNVSHEQFREEESGKVFSVIDLSSEGLGIRILDSEDLARFTLAKTVRGMLNLRREKYPVTFRIMRVSADRVGGKFEALVPESRDALTRFFDPKTLGEELRPMPGAEEGSLWYHGASGTDAMFWRRADGSYSRFVVFVMSSYIQWDEERGASTGATSGLPEGVEDRGFMRLETIALTPDAQIDAGKLEIAKTLILSSNLPQDLRRWCARQLSPV